MSSHDEMAMIPYIVYEASEAKSERTIKRLIITLILTMVLMFGSNMLWLYAWNQYDYTSEVETVTYKQDGEGYNNINMGTQGDVANGTECEKNNEETNTH